MMAAKTSGLKHFWVSCCVCCCCLARSSGSSSGVNVTVGVPKLCRQLVRTSSTSCRAAHQPAPPHHLNIPSLAPLNPPQVLRHFAPPSYPSQRPVSSSAFTCLWIQLSPATSVDQLSTNLGESLPEWTLPTNHVGGYPLLCLLILTHMTPADYPSPPPTVSHTSTRV